MGEICSENRSSGRFPNDKHITPEQTRQHNAQGAAPGKVASHNMGVTYLERPSSGAKVECEAGRPFCILTQGP